MPAALLSAGLRHAAAATGLAAGVWALTRLWRNPHAGRPLWGAVTVKLLCPPLLAVAVWAPAAQPAQTNRDRQGAARATPEPAAAPAAAPADPLPRRSRDRQGAARATPEPRETRPTRIEAAPPATAAPPSPAAAPVPPARTGPLPDGRGSGGFAAVLLTVWIAGTVFIWTLAAVRAWRFGRRVRRLPDAGESAQARLAAAAGSMNVPPPRLKVSGSVGPLAWAAPWRCGRLARPAVVVPAGLLDGLDGPAAEALLAHECAHLARRDELWRSAELLACGLWWWLPTAWLAAAAGRRCGELCCDAAVLARPAAPGAAPHPDPAGPYAAALLAAAEFRLARRGVSRSLAALPVPSPASGAGRPAFLKERFRMICQNTLPPRPGRRARWPLAAACCALAAVGVTAAQDEPPESPPDAAPRGPTVGAGSIPPATAMPRGTLRTIAGPGSVTDAASDDRAAVLATVTGDGRLLIRGREPGEIRVTYTRTDGTAGALVVRVADDARAPGRTLADVATAFNADAAAVGAAGGPVSAEEIRDRLRRSAPPTPDTPGEFRSYHDAVAAFLAGDPAAIRPRDVVVNDAADPPSVRFRYWIPTDEPGGFVNATEYLREGGDAVGLAFQDALAKWRRSGRPTAPTLAEAVAAFNADPARVEAAGSPITEEDVRESLWGDLAGSAIRGRADRDRTWTFAVGAYLNGNPRALHRFRLEPSGRDGGDVTLHYGGPSLDGDRASSVRRGGRRAVPGAVSAEEEPASPAEQETSPPGEEPVSAPAGLTFADAVAAFNAPSRRPAGERPLTAEELRAAIARDVKAADAAGSNPNEPNAVSRGAAEGLRKTLATGRLEPGALIVRLSEGGENPQTERIELRQRFDGEMVSTSVWKRNAPTDAPAGPTLAALAATYAAEFPNAPPVTVDDLRDRLGVLLEDAPTEPPVAGRVRNLLRDALATGRAPAGARLVPVSSSLRGVPTKTEVVLELNDAGGADGPEVTLFAVGPTLAEAIAAERKTRTHYRDERPVRPVTVPELEAAIRAALEPADGGARDEAAAALLRTVLETGRLPADSGLSLTRENGTAPEDVNLVLGGWRGGVLGVPVREDGLTPAVAARVRDALAAAAADDALPVETRLKLLRETAAPGSLTDAQTAWLFAALAETEAAGTAGPPDGVAPDEFWARLRERPGIILETMAALGVAAPDAAAARRLSFYVWVEYPGDAKASAEKVLKSTAATAAGLRTLLAAAALPVPAVREDGGEDRRDALADEHRGSTAALLDAVRQARPATDDAARVLLEAAASDDPAVRAAAVEALAAGGG